MKRSQENSTKIIIIISALILSIFLVFVIFSYERTDNFVSGSATINKQYCSTMGGTCRVLIHETPNLGCEEGEFLNEHLLCGLSQTGKESVCCLK